MDLKELQEKYEALGKEIEALKNKPVNNRWRAVLEDKYFYIDDCGDTMEAHDLIDEFDYYRYNTGDYFKTKEGAEKYKQKLLAEQELKDLANGYEFVEGEHNYIIVYSNNTFKVDCVSYRRTTGVCFQSREEALNAIDTLGEAKLKLIFGVK